MHPQHWPGDLDLAGRRVVVIGSGATAVTLVPALTSGENAAAHVTMLQRTPTYVMPLPRRDRVALALKKLLGPERAHGIVRAKNIARGQWIWNLSRKRPGILRKVIRQANVASLPAGYPVDTHFKPPYGPWDQRLCADPDGIFFAAVASGRADVVTDRIDRVTPSGIRLASGAELPADVIITATGLEVQLMGGIELAVDGEPVDLREAMTYRSCMLTGLPNFIFAMGYTNQSWTLRLGLVCDWFVRLLEHMERTGHEAVVVEPDPAVAARSALDFDAGYVKRAAASLPRQGDVRPWTVPMDFYADRRLLTKGPVVDEHLRFFSARTPVPSAPSHQEVTG
ncbi:flavin-containing monooxygenase [Nocardioides daphniae]|uniref:flavin-containing monooxygenase n=1 Tax=Nocardioides daphniae TaxID=402297 RepID=UPI001930F8D4|nr:NAD(P)/FAD-dependent oxidoreductase [Nocardioides daphniae]